MWNWSIDKKGWGWKKTSISTSQDLNSVLETLAGSESGRELSPRPPVSSPALFQPVSYLIVRICHGPLYENEVKCSAFHMEMIFHSNANKTHFHKQGCALGLILKVRVFWTRKWPTVFNEKYITFTDIEVACHITGQVNYGIVSGNNLCMHRNNSLWR